MVRYVRSRSLSFLIVFLGTVSIYAADYALASGHTSVRAGVVAVEQFYSALLASGPVEDCPSIFSPDGLTSTNTCTEDSRLGLAKKWSFLRQNKSLFLTDRYEKGEFHKPEDFVAKSRKMISFFNPRTIEQYTDGLLYITLVSTVERAGRDGVYKEISFPIVPVDGGEEYRIEFTGIKVNGVLLDFHGDFERSDNLLQRLGFDDHGSREAGKHLGRSPDTEIK